MTFTPIASVFATVRHTLVTTASNAWLKQNGTNRFPGVIEAVTSTDRLAHRHATESRAN